MPAAYAVPLLPCPDLDEALEFYELLGFQRTYRQIRPNPYGSVQRSGIEIGLFGISGFDPAESYASAILVVDDLDGWYRDFTAGFRYRYGKLRATGIPRILRPRKRQGELRGFTIVDTGGNWLRLSQLGDKEPATRATGLAQVMENAARLGDSHGDVERALAVLTAGLDRHPGAPAIERARAHLYTAELAARLGDMPRAYSALDHARASDLTDIEEAEISGDLAHAEEIVNSVRDTPTQ
jgi:hypothetical protein